MPLSPETQAALEAALSDKAAAATADADDSAAAEAVAKATQDEVTKKQASIDAHKKALDSAHTALNAVMTELGVSPEPAPPSPT